MQHYLSQVHPSLAEHAPDPGKLHNTHTAPSDQSPTTRTLNRHIGVVRTVSVLLTEILW